MLIPSPYLFLIGGDNVIVGNRFTTWTFTKPKQHNGDNVRVVFGQISKLLSIAVFLRIQRILLPLTRLDCLFQMLL
jgi:hypothetical protein